MNDFSISGANAYPHSVNFKGDGQNVDSVGVSGTGETSSPTEGRNVTLTRANQSVAPSTGNDKNVLVVASHADLSDIEEAGDALENFITGLKQSDEENGTSNKNIELNHERRAESEEKVENAEVIIQKALENAEKVGNKSAAASNQINALAQIVIWKNAEDNADKTQRGRNLGWQITALALQALSTCASAAGSFIDGDKLFTHGSGENKKVTKWTEKSQKITSELSSKFLGLGAEVANFFQVNADADADLVQRNRDQARRATLQKVTGTAQNLTRIFTETGNKAQELLNKVREELLDATKRIPVANV